MNAGFRVGCSGSAWSQTAERIRHVANAPGHGWRLMPVLGGVVAGRIGMKVRNRH